MSDKIVLTVQGRQAEGKAAKQVRSQGFVPGVVYGDGVTPHSVMAEQVVMTKVYRSAGKHHPIELDEGGKKQLAMIKAVDIDPVKRTLRHVSFHAIKQNQPVETEVPVIITSEGGIPAERAGLVVLSTVEVVEVSALPAHLPDQLEVSGESLVAAGDRLTVADIVAPAKVTILSDPEQVIASVYEPSALAAKNEAAAGDVTEEPASETAAETTEETVANEED